MRPHLDRPINPTVKATGRNWCIGILLMFGLSAIIIATTAPTHGEPQTAVLPVDPQVPVTITDFRASGVNPNLTREGYAVTLSSKAPGALPIFDPAGRGSTSLWGLGVDKMRLAFYGSDNSWHETSFQINEVGWRWVANGTADYFSSGRDGDYGTTGERQESLLESMNWQQGYVPDRFYPDLRDRFYADRNGMLPMDADAATYLQYNWPEFHQSSYHEGWATNGSAPSTNSQVRGALDYDDEIVFLAQNGRKVENTIWYQGTATWPYRFEVDITDPVDGGHSWVYLYYNPDGHATTPTGRNQISNDYRRTLAYTAPGETDQVSFDKETLTIVARNYRLQFDRYHASRFKDLRITLPGLQATSIFSEFPKDFIQLQGQINFGGTNPYASIVTGLFLRYGLQGSWYRDAPPGITPLTGTPNMAAGSNTVRDYDDSQSGIGVFYHRGDPDQLPRGTGSGAWAYGLLVQPTAPLDLGWRGAAGAQVEGRIPRWWTSTGTGSAEYLSGTVPAVTTPGSIAMRNRWERIDRTLEPFDTTNPGRGYFWMDQNLYVYDSSTGTYVILYRPWAAGWPYTSTQNDVLGQSNPNWADRTATIDGPAMCYVERIVALKANAPLEWIRPIDADYIALLAGGAQASDGCVGNFDFYKQNDVVAYPNRLESRGNTYPTITLPPEIMDPAINTRIHHAFGYFGMMQFDQAISTGTVLYMGPGANVTDATYGATMNLLESSTWVNARNFPHFYRIQQLGTDGATPITRDYHPWDWMNEVPNVPASWYSAGARTYTLDGNPGNDASYTANSPPMFGGQVREYHPWWDYTGTEVAYREQWLGTSSWRTTHLRARVTASVATGQGWSTEFEPPVRTPRDPFTNVVSAINYPADWFIVSVPNAGDVWVYQPTREIKEVQSQGYTRTLQPPLAIMDRDQAMGIKDSDMKEAGLFAARCTLGGSVIPFTRAWQFDDMGITSATDALAKGKREWVRNRFALDSIFGAFRQQPGGIVVQGFGPAGHGLFYKPGDTVNLEIISNWNSDVVTFRTSAGGITSSPATPVLASGPVAVGAGIYRHTVSFTWTSSTTENVGPGLAPRYDYYWVYADFGSPVQGTASCGLLYDNVVPTPATFTLPTTTGSPAVIIDWTATKGSDNSDGTYPAPDDKGIKEYTVLRGGSPVATVPYGTFTFVDDNGGAGFSNGTALQYQLRTTDQAGNTAHSGVVSTTIALPIANPASFNAQWNRDLDGPAAGENPVAVYNNATISWSDDPGAGITNYRIYVGPSPTGPFRSNSTLLAFGTTSYTIRFGKGNNSVPVGPDTYWYVIDSINGPSVVRSAPMAIVYDPQPDGIPLPASITWTAGPVYAPTERRVPIDVSGSSSSIDPGWIADDDPANTGSGIWRYLVYMMETDNPASWPGSWTLVGTVARDAMESAVWYHDYGTGLVNDRYYRYLVQSQDFSSPFPSITWPNGMVNSQYIEFRFAYTPSFGLRIWEITASTSAADQGQTFTITAKVANVGTTTLIPTDLTMSVTQSGIDKTSSFWRTGPVPSLAAIGAGMTVNYVYTYTARTGDPQVLGLVTFGATVTWATGSHLFPGSTQVKINDISMGVTAVSIIGINIMAPRVAPGPYVTGETFTLRVTFCNTGTLDASVDATIDDGAYTGLSWSDPSNQTVHAGGTAYQDFAVTASAGAATAAVTITATWRGSEATTTRSLYGDTPADTLTINIMQKASVCITGLAITAPRAAPGPYGIGEALTLRVTFSNTAQAGSASASVDATVDDGSYTYLTFSNPANVTVNAGGTATQDFTINVAPTALLAAVTLTVTWRGSEAISTRCISGDTPVDTLAINVGVSISVSITSIGIVAPRVAPGPYVAGEAFTLRVTFCNTGTLDASVDATIDDGAYTGLSWSDPSNVTVHAGGTAYQDFAITVSTGAATAAVTLAVTWRGSEATTTRSLYGDTPADTLFLYIQSGAALAVQAVVLNASQASPGSWVLAMVTVGNVGGTGVHSGSVTLLFNSSHAVDPTPVGQASGLAVAAGGTVVVAIRFRVSDDAPGGSLIGVDALFMAVESISGANRTASATTGPALLVVEDGASASSAFRAVSLLASGIMVSCGIATIAWRRRHARTVQRDF